ncbi:FAD-dependent thymidylate synthase [Methanofollis aquaemaris]|uniref:FAD-dependent thymidylate synthase n=1 Tax=Methanofollis aquaemaris TaxID=126734 RepID=UPI00223FEDEC|nr:FAD-dependent thymidylate synthase [Methanofollis aquaemaris]
MSIKVELLAITPDAERLIESAGRTAYRSFDRQAPGSEKKFIRMIVKNGHESVLEHAYATFRISGISRACSHQLVRHRLCAITQQSQRYVSEDDFPAVEPASVAGNEEAHALYAEYLERTRETYKALADLGVRREDARFVLPNATETEMVVSANMREWRHIVGLRGSRGAQWEIRALAIALLRIFRDHVPTVFCDFEVDEEQQVIRRVEV